MKEVKIFELTERCIKYFREHCYTESSILEYRKLWRAGIVRYMSRRGIESYSPSVGVDFVLTCHSHGTVRKYDRQKIRSVKVLDDMMVLGHIRKRCITPVFHTLDGVIGSEMEKFVSHLVKLRRTKNTIRNYRSYLSDFLTHIKSRGISRVTDISEDDILIFFAAHPNKAEMVSALHGLFRFWGEKHITDSCFDELFATYKKNYRKKERILSFYTASEVMQIEQSVSRSSGVGKRNYAMVLLASRLGLRASDIAGLQFSDIDWDRSIITLTMQKTRKVIELPLLADVGNAIIDYLRNGRRHSMLQNVFLSEVAPYTAATPTMVSTAIRVIVNKSGVDTSGRHSGAHSLRHSLASTMLEGGTTIPVISESLGHRSTQTTMTYLKIDISSLMKCALPVPGVADKFYMQRGGAFYD